MGWLDGQVALITGGGSGIGRAIVERFIEEGARVGVMDRFSERVEELQHDFGESLVGIHGDVSLLADNKTAVEQTVRSFGRLDVFAGNAGIFDSNLNLDETPEDQISDSFDELFAVNVKGCLLGAKASLAELRKTQGCMVFTASVAGLNSGGGGPMYTASKHAVVGLIKELAAELAPEIRVNGVAPGGVMTDLRGLETAGRAGSSHFADPGTGERMRVNNPQQRALQPRDIANSFLFLASRENAAGITGSVIPTDAGSLLRWRRPGS